jgi:hypothetical protein
MAGSPPGVTAGPRQAAESQIPPRFAAGIQDQPPLEVRQVAGGVRLLLGQLDYGEGANLQEAANDLVARVLALVMAFQSGRHRPVLK